MPQVVALWCEDEGHDVTSVCYTGFEDLVEELPDDVDIVFIGAFTESAQTAYALSHLFRSRGAITGARRPPRPLLPAGLATLLRLRHRVHRQEGRARNPRRLLPPPAVRAASHCGAAAACPPRRPGALEVHRADPAEGPLHQDGPDARQPRLSLHLQFLHRLDRALPAPRLRGDEGRPPVPPDEVQRRPLVGWHDPNFGIRFDDYVDAIEEAIPAGQHRLHRREQPFDS